MTPALPQAGLTFLDVLRLRARESPAAVGYVVVGEDDERRELTYGELDLRSRTLAARLQALGLAGERVLIVQPPGVEYLSAFFGCMYAGAVAVPAYPPSGGRNPRGLERLHAVATSANPKAIITGGALAQRIVGALRGADGRDVHILETPVPDEGRAAAWRAPAIAADDLAFLQYSSGSTGTPKGVCLTHANLMHNSELIRRAFGHDAGSRGVVWLPPYHDMGLIGGILQPLYVGFPVLLFPPVAFLQRPVRWLRAVTEFGATTTGGPNFAYDLCVRRISDAEKEGLDLSRWDVAFTGAEPIRSATLERFAAAFERCGFRREAFQPCYGLAEATLIVSGGDKGAGATVLPVGRRGLESHHAHDIGTPDASVPIVACGRVLEGIEVVTADPELQTPLPDGEIGEIWVRGPSVARGYWRMPAESAAAFCGRLRGDAPGDGPAFLRTGDLGFTRDRRLYVTGRLKDLIIVRGRNFYPQDIEAAAQASHPMLRAEGGAAFSVDDDGEERIVIVHEVERPFEWSAAGEIRDAVRDAVSRCFEIAVSAVVLIRPGSLPRTSSGKVRRRACREAFCAGRLASYETAPPVLTTEETR